MRPRVRKIWTLAVSVFTFFVALFSLSLKLSVPIMQLYEASLDKESFADAEIGTLSPSVPILEEPGGVALCDLPWFVEERQAAAVQEKAGLLHLCRKAGILTVQQGGRLGNQIWEYASVWGLSQEAAWLTPVAPRCLLRAIDDAFPFLSLPELNDTMLQRGCTPGVRPEPEPALSRPEVLKILKDCKNEQSREDCEEKDQGCCKKNMVLQR
ncbi:hypothetical protein J437_LFUL008154 [Ladona fulva]|uniref:Uncharacterized protein n=1 Tax=Ladona fulva TaxID=123851 RepID=A0A8K0NUU4_LADFU|nr:hypothetical protein J437_LFUL008154 [Ladona fulva]